MIWRITLHTRKSEEGGWRLPWGCERYRARQTLHSLFILVTKGVAVNSKNCSVLPWKCKKCASSALYFVLPLTIISVNLKSECVYSCLSYTACNPHIFCAVMYRHLRPVWPSQVLLYYRTNGKISGKKSLNIKYMFWLSLQLLSKTFLNLRRIQRVIILHMHRS